MPAPGSGPVAAMALPKLSLGDIRKEDEIGGGACASLPACRSPFLVLFTQPDLVTL
jgi:hypothetical protein